jgi:hypothetical protein
MTQKRSLISTRRCTVAASASVSNSKVSAISVRPTGASRSTPSVPRASQWPSTTTLPPRSCTPIAVATALTVTPATVAGMLQAYRANDLRQPIWSSNHDPRGSDDLGDFANSARLSLPMGGFTSPPSILGAGHDIWDPADAFHYVYKPIEGGAVELTARVVGVQNTSEWAKAGVMIRESLDADSPHAMVVLTPGNGAAFQHRPGKGMASRHVPFPRPVTAPFWVRIKRVQKQGSSVFRGSISGDGNDWQQIGMDAEIPMGAHAFAGMAVTAAKQSFTGPGSGDKVPPISGPSPDLAWSAQPSGVE